MHEVIAATSSPGLFEALGINVRLLIEQAAAFLVLVWVLGKFVYPALMKAIDDRRAQIEAGLAEAKQSAEALEKAEAKAAALLGEARAEADDIVARTQKESATMLAEAETKAKERAEHIVSEARAQLESDVAKARQALKRDTVELVALATERVVGAKLDNAKDQQLIKSSLEDKA